MNSTPSRADSFRAPPNIPGHEVLRLIGTGVFGEVWLARNLLLGAYRVVKVVYSSRFAEECSFVGTEGYVPPEGPGHPQAAFSRWARSFMRCLPRSTARITQDCPAAGLPSPATLS
jgi:hypothetical protein